MCLYDFFSRNKIERFNLKIEYLVSAKLHLILLKNTLVPCEMYNNYLVSGKVSLMVPKLGPR